MNNWKIKSKEVKSKDRRSEGVMIFFITQSIFLFFFSAMSSSSRLRLSVSSCSFQLISSFLLLVFSP